jgi:hypothetical protein
MEAMKNAHQIKIAYTWQIKTLGMGIGFVGKITHVIPIRNW